MPLALQIPETLSCHVHNFVKAHNVCIIEEFLKVNIARHTSLTTLFKISSRVFVAMLCTIALLNRLSPSAMTASELSSLEDESSIISFMIGV